MKQLKFTLLFLLVCFSALSAAKQETQWLDKMDLTQYENKVVYLDFWASWCGPCRKSFPWLNSMHQKYQDKGLVIIGINLDRDISQAEHFLHNTPASFLLHSDPTGVIGEQYQLVGMPSAYLLTSDGTVNDKHVGFKKSDRAEYEAKIVKLLSQLPQNKE